MEAIDGALAREGGGTFAMTLAPDGVPAQAGDSRARMTFTKDWSGLLCGASDGVMLSAGSPAGGAAGYVALERFEGTLDGRHGSFALQQCGTMEHGRDSLLAVVTPGSGTGALAGLAGTLAIERVDGQHRYSLQYALPG